MLQRFRHIAFFVITLPLLLSSCATHRRVKDISCYLNDTVKQSDMRLTTTFHATTGHSDTICDTDDRREEIEIMPCDGGIRYGRTVLDKRHNIESFYAYDEDGYLRYCRFAFVPDKVYNGGVLIGRDYTFNQQGDITETCNHEEGYSICYKQAMYIGDRFCKRKASKKFPTRILARGTRQGKKIWEYHYMNRKRQKKMLVIDGCSGKVLKELEVIVTY